MFVVVVYYSCCLLLLFTIPVVCCCCCLLFLLFVVVVVYYSCCFTDNLSQFRAAIRRSDSRHSHLSKRNRSTHSTSSHDDGSSFQRQASNQSGNMLTALSDQISRYSVEDLPIAAHPSPALGRKVQSQENTVNENVSVCCDISLVM